MMISKVSPLNNNPLSQLSGPLTASEVDVCGISPFQTNLTVSPTRTVNSSGRKSKSLTSTS